MGGNAFSREDVDQDLVAISVDETKPTGISKSDVNEQKGKQQQPKDKFANREMIRAKSKEDKTQGNTKCTSSNQVVGNLKATSKDVLPRENKPKSKEKKKLIEEKKTVKDTGKDEKDVFARIAAGEQMPFTTMQTTTTGVKDNNNKNHGHILQKGRYRYSPGFEFIRNTTKESPGETQKQKTKKSAENMTTQKVQKQTEDKKYKLTTSAEAINRPVMSLEEKKTAKKSPDMTYTKKFKTKNEKSTSDKQRKQKRAKSDNTNATGAGKDMATTKSIMGGGKIRPQELKSKGGGKSGSSKKGGKPAKPKSIDPSAANGKTVNNAEGGNMKAAEQPAKSKEPKKNQ